MTLLGAPLCHLVALICTVNDTFSSLLDCHSMLLYSTQVTPPTFGDLELVGTCLAPKLVSNNTRVFSSCVD